MNGQPTRMSTSFSSPLDRRGFLGGTLHLATAAAVYGAAAARAEEKAAPPESKPAITRKFKLGVVGCGGRGTFVAQHFLKHGGYEIHAAADYFPDAANRFGKAFGIDPSRCFSGLNGYLRVIESGVDIVALEHMPYFMPIHAAAAVAAGKHVYMAKPVAVDVPDTLRIGQLGREATQKKLCFLVDYQMPTAPANIEVRSRILAGGLGRLAHVTSFGMAGRWKEPNAKTPRPEYLRNSLWLHHLELAADACVSFDIHAIDAMMWVLGKRPLCAMGCAETRRDGAFLSGRDSVHAVMQMEDGVTWNHHHQSLSNQQVMTGESGSLVCMLHGTSATAVVTYSGKAYVRGGPKHYVGSVGQLYPAGVVSNVASLYRNLTEGRFENETVPRTVDGHLAAILMREASYRHTRLTMDELLRENKKLEFDTSGFVA